MCDKKGGTHGSLNAPPDMVTGCVDDLTQDGGLDSTAPATTPTSPEEVLR